MKRIYMTPSVRVHHLRVESQILAGTMKINGAQSALTEKKVQNLNLDNEEYGILYNQNHTETNKPFLEVE